MTTNEHLEEYDNAYDGFCFAHIAELVPSREKDELYISTGLIPLIFERKSDEDVSKKFQPGMKYDIKDFVVDGYANPEKAQERIDLLKESNSGYFVLRFGFDMMFGSSFYFILNQNEQIEFMEKEDVDNMARITLL
jgi:hypothetical protein